MEYVPAKNGLLSAAIGLFSKWAQLPSTLITTKWRCDDEGEYPPIAIQLFERHTARYQFRVFCIWLHFHLNGVELNFICQTIPVHIYPDECVGGEGFAELQTN